MANISLTKENIKYLRDAFSHFFPEDTIYSADKPYISGEFNWESRRSFIDFVYRLTGVQIKSDKDFQNIKKAQLAVEELTETGSGKPESNILAPDKLKQLEEEEKSRTEKLKQTRDQAEKSVKEAIEKQKEIYAKEIQKAKAAEAALKDQKVYYKIGKEPIEKTQEIKNLKQQTEADPKKFIDDATNQFKVNPNLKNLTADEALVVSQQAAGTTYDALTGNSPVVQMAIINKIASDSELLNKLVPNLDQQKILKDFASTLIEQKRAQFELTKQFVDLSKIDGHNSPDNVNVELSFVPKEGFEEFSINQQIVSPSIENLNQQNLLLGNLNGFGEGEIKSQILLSIGNRFESYVAKLPANSLLAKTYNSEIVQLGLSSIGIVEAAPWIAVEGSALGKIVIGSGFGQVAGFIQAKTGINLGIKLAAKVGTETAVKAGTTAVVKTGLKAAFSKITAALGSAGGPIGTALAWLGGELFVKITEKIPWKKIKEWSAAIIGGVAGLIALPFLGPGAAIGIGAGATAISAGLGAGLGGATLAGVGSGIAGFFGALGGAFLGAVGMPILITFLAFPVAVAIILFIINSGAYVVPPGGVPGSAFINGGGEGLPIVCSIEKGQVGVGGPSSTSPIGNRAWKITHDLYQGFWCFWNRSPIAPPQYFPSDTLEYPPGYPNLFDYALFKRNPNPADDGGINLFWCTWLVVKAYNETGNTIPTSLWVPDMYNDFLSKKKILSADVATAKTVLPGSVVFFHVTTGQARLNHVGVVYAVDKAGIDMVQSNAPTKYFRIPFSQNGTGVVNEGVMLVEYFGLP